MSERRGMMVVALGDGNVGAKIQLARNKKTGAMNVILSMHHVPGERKCGDKISKNDLAADPCCVLQFKTPLSAKVFRGWINLVIRVFNKLEKQVVPENSEKK